MPWIPIPKNLTQPVPYSPLRPSLLKTLYFCPLIGLAPRVVGQTGNFQFFRAILTRRSLCNSTFSIRSPFKRPFTFCCQPLTKDSDFFGTWISRAWSPTSSFNLAFCSLSWLTSLGVATQRGCLPWVGLCLLPKNTWARNNTGQRKSLLFGE